MVDEHNFFLSTLVRQCDKAVKVVKEGDSVVALIGAVTPPGTT